MGAESHTDHSNGAQTWTLTVRKDGSLSDIYVERFGDRRVLVAPVEDIVRRLHEMAKVAHVYKTLDTVALVLAAEYGLAALDERQADA